MSNTFMYMAAGGIFLYSTITDPNILLYEGNIFKSVRRIRVWKEGWFSRVGQNHSKNENTVLILRALVYETRNKSLFVTNLSCGQCVVVSFFHVFHLSAAMRTVCWPPPETPKTFLVSSCFPSIRTGVHASSSPEWPSWPLVPIPQLQNSKEGSFHGFISKGLEI